MYMYIFQRLEKRDSDIYLCIMFIAPLFTKVKGEKTQSDDQKING